MSVMVYTESQRVGIILLVRLLALRGSLSPILVTSPDEELVYQISCVAAHNCFIFLMEIYFC